MPLETESHGLLSECPLISQAGPLRDEIIPCDVVLVFDADALERFSEFLESTVVAVGVPGMQMPFLDSDVISL